ncbi:MAG TPA: hypothetical protein VNU95_05995 [Candidatus Acidoferrales bacterium]|jgi:hypothetical protein|nr:hypothetical protein [Candidatus Acidoferrales bacterium]
MSGPIRTTFCGVDTVSCVVGLSVPRIYDLVESGRYLWVWNVSSGVGARRELRFWSREINDPASVAGLTLDAVIKSVIPHRGYVPGQRQGLHNWEFRHLLRLSKPSVCELRKELGIRGAIRHLFIPRSRLEQFFRSRWIGNIDAPKSKSVPAIPAQKEKPRRKALRRRRRTKR